MHISLPLTKHMCEKLHLSLWLRVFDLHGNLLYTQLKQTIQAKRNGHCCEKECVATCVNNLVN